MMTIAAAFARAILPQPDVPKAVRIGLDSQSNSELGKSTFAAAMIGTLTGKQSVEKNHDFRPQDVWQIPGAGWVRHYDAGCAWPDAALSSYVFNDADKKYGLPFTDIVEHPAFDKNNLMFDYMVFFMRAGSAPDARYLIFVTSQELALTQKFQTFLDSTAQWLDQRNQNGFTRRLPAATPT